MCITIALIVWNGISKVDKKWYEHCLEAKKNSDWWYYSYDKEAPCSTIDRSFFIGIKWAVIIIISIIVASILNDFIKLTFAPNVYILEYLQSMM